MKTTTLADLVAPFFTQHLRQHRNVSQYTVAAYRDTFRLLFRFFKKIDRRQPADLELGELTMERILVFLNHLERERNNTVRTRNARLAAIRCFVHYAQDLLGPDLPQPTRRILTIPPKRHTKPILGFLTRAELEAILNGCGNTWTGQRDHLLFLLLYNTGARISEVLGLRVRDVLATGGRSLTLHGKGRKERTVPLWTTTQTRLRHWIKENDLPPEGPLLPNRFGQPITRSGAAWQLRRLVRRAAERIPSLKQRRISPHTFRHYADLRTMPISKWLERRVSRQHGPTAISRRYSIGIVLAGSEGLEKSQQGIVRFEELTGPTRLVSFGESFFFEGQIRIEINLCGLDGLMS